MSNIDIANMQYDPRASFLVLMLINLAIFLLTFSVVYYGLGSVGWKPEAHLRPEERQLTLWQLFMLLSAFIVLTTWICFRCGLVTDGIVAGVLLAMLMKLAFQLKLRY